MGKGRIKKKAKLVNRSKQLKKQKSNHLKHIHNQKRILQLQKKKRQRLLEENATFPYTVDQRYVTVHHYTSFVYNFNLPFLFIYELIEYY